MSALRSANSSSVFIDPVPAQSYNLIHTQIPPLYQVAAIDTQIKLSFSSYYIYKRILDVVLASLLLPLIVPLMLVIAMAIKCDSPGPAIFAQKRMSARPKIVNGVAIWQPYEFTFYKFRSMYHRNDPTVHKEFVEALIRNDEQKMNHLQGGTVSDTSKYKLHNDKRITRVGHFIRKTSLDELPQLINVLKGDMSLVGPRPAIGYEVEIYSDQHMKRLAAQPGITGLWQVRARSSVAFDTMVNLDVQYINNQSLRLDIEILIDTVRAVFARDGAC